MENYQNKTNPHMNDEVNYTELIDIGRKQVNGDDIKLGIYYINLALLSPNLDPQSKIQALAIKSFAHFKMKEGSVVYSVVNKVLKYMAREKVELFEQAVLFCIVRMLYRGGSLMLENKQIYLAAFCLYYAKKLFEFKALRAEKESYETLENTIKPLLSDITTEISKIKAKYNILEEDKSNSHELMAKLQRLKAMFAKREEEAALDNSTPNENETDSVMTDTTTSTQNISKEKYYLISALWVKNLITFINKFEKYAKTDRFYDHLDKIFSKTYVLNLYFSDDGNYDFAHYGIHPCEVNNFFIMQFKDSWVDPDKNEENTNVYLRKGITENSDFFYLNERDWEFVKETFGCNYEIMRKTAVISGNMLIEVNLRKIKVLVLNESLRDSNINLIKPRNIQISKEHTIKDLKEKVLRCISPYTNYESNVNLEVKVYLFNFGMKNKKKDTFEMVYAYTNKFNSFNLLAEEVVDDSIVIENFKYGPGDLLVIEICNFTTGEASTNSRFIKVITENRDCNLCEKSIPVDKVVRCTNCNSYVYCSEDCRRKDELHITYHNNVNKLYKKKFNFNELVEIKLEELIERNAKHGLVGLKNLGNTCFMNSALHCLSHCEDLTKYFLTKKVFDEINRNNKLGTGGEVAKAYYELLQDLWQGNSPYLGPTDFRQIFVRFVKQFAGFSQHDSHEMLTFMLDTLHEDLNRVKQKPYVEMKEKTEKENDEEGSQRWWKNHVTRENSIIVDLFHGQYKSVITCPECSKISITYDPFMYLGLPIPSGHYKIKFKYFPYINIITPKTYIYEYEVPINDHFTAKDMKTKVLQSRGKGEIVDSYSLEAVAFTKDKSFKKIVKDEELIFNFFDSGYEIAIYEKYPSDCTEANVDDYVTFYIIPTELVEERSMLFMKKVFQRVLSYPMVVSLNKNSSIKDLYFQVYKNLRKVLVLNDKDFSLKHFLENAGKKDGYLEEEFMYYFNNLDSAAIRLSIVNNVPEQSGFFSSSKPNCEYCSAKCEFCPLHKAICIPSIKTPIQKLILVQQVRRPFLLYAELQRYSPSSAKIYENLDFPITPVSKYLIQKQTGINIYDCINLFRSEERLEKENAWYCPTCKSHQEAFKRLEVYKAPNYLIVQFKRFKIRSHSAVMGMIANKKNDVLIDFPIEGLDLREYVVGEDRGDAVYDLIGISQHYGGLSSGHYTAICKNFGRWYDFDDERVTKAGDIVDSAAYMLFYRKRSLANLA